MSIRHVPGQMIAWIAMVILLLSFIVVPFTVHGYSYGDPNQDELAEEFKSMVAEDLSSNPPDWTTTSMRVKTRDSEIRSHFGASVADTLQEQVNRQNREAFVAIYLGLLALNVERRLTYAKSDFSDYAKAKVLLAKANGTLLAMEPYFAEKDPEAFAGIRNAMEVMLDALGNPGLFGIGKVEPDPELFQQNQSKVILEVKRLFPFEAVVPSVIDKLKPAGTRGEQTVKPSKTVERAKEADISAKETVIPEATAKTGTIAQSAVSTAAPTANVDSSDRPVLIQNGSTSDVEPTSQPAAAHGAMERQDMTNAGVTIGVIVFMVLIAVGVFYWVYRK